MNIETLLDRLDHVRAAGSGKWVARCPAHRDRRPSLSIRALDDGRILIHDFAGCPPVDVLAAVGMELADLFPEKLDHHKGPTRDRKHFHAAREALKLLALESLVVVIAAENMVQGDVLDAADRNRLTEAALRIRQAREVVI